MKLAIVLLVIAAWGLAQSVGQSLSYFSNGVVPGAVYLVITLWLPALLTLWAVRRIRRHILRKRAIGQANEKN